MFSANQKRSENELIYHSKFWHAEKYSKTNTNILLYITFMDSGEDLQGKFSKQSLSNCFFSSV